MGRLYQSISHGETGAMADHQEEFLRKYFHMAYKLSLPDILDQISELDKFSVRLCEKGFLTKDDLFKIIQASNPRMRKNVLHKILLGKEDYWLASPSDPDDSGVLAAICEMNASAADYTVVTVLEAFHHILDKVLDSDTPVQSSIFGETQVSFTMFI
ncbi:uncharacterized protein LOC135466044 isoform X2 [Liolophura sinensis]|uniref:uncharacterized protein LOC135466044 isoform X2 n=1 Tax=Liolophura sinensis TaxID=3198878 RepID=UPI00315836B2